MSEADPVLHLLGLAARAGGIVAGTGRVRESAADGSLRFALVAADASDNSRAKLLPLLVGRGVKHAIGFDRARLGAAVGRAPLSAVGVTQPSLAERLRTLMMVAGADDRSGE